MSNTAIYGMKIIVTPDLPKMKLAPGDYITPEFRQEIDAWLLGFFGTNNLLEDGQSIFSQPTNTVFMNPRTCAKLRSVA